MTLHVPASAAAVHALGRLVLVRRQDRQHRELAVYCMCAPSLEVAGRMVPQKPLATIFVRPERMDDWAHGGPCWTYRRFGEVLGFHPSLNVPGHFHTKRPWYVAVANVEGWR